MSAIVRKRYFIFVSLVFAIVACLVVLFVTMGRVGGGHSPPRAEKSRIFHGYVVFQRVAFWRESFHHVHVVVVVIAISTQPRLRVEVHHVHNRDGTAFLLRLWT